MIPRNTTDSDAKRTRLCGTSAPPDLHGDPDKATVMRWISEIVADGLAEWEMLIDGDIQLRFNSGATFLLAKSHIVRLA
jgi:hypothetical protein